MTEYSTDHGDHDFGTYVAYDKLWNQAQKDCGQEMARCAGLLTAWLGARVRFLIARRPHAKPPVMPKALEH